MRTRVGRRLPKRGEEPDQLRIDRKSASELETEEFLLNREGLIQFKRENVREYPDRGR